MSPSTSRTLPESLLSHPSVKRLIAQGQREGQVSPQRHPRDLRRGRGVRRASQGAAQAPGSGGRDRRRRRRGEHQPQEGGCRDRIPRRRVVDGQEGRCEEDVAQEGREQDDHEQVHDEGTGQEGRDRDQDVQPGDRREAVRQGSAQDDREEGRGQDREDRQDGDQGRPRRRRRPRRPRRATRPSPWSRRSRSRQPPCWSRPTDGKKALADIDDSVFEKDLATDPTLKEDEKQGFTISEADEADEPEQTVTVAGATADPVKDYLKQIGKVPLLNAEMEVELAKRIEAGLFSEEKLGRDEQDLGQDARRADLDRRGRTPRQEPPARGQPASRRLAGQALHRPRHALPRPDPGGQPRPDPRGREVRLHQGLQVLDVRHLVDPSGDHPGDGRPGAHDPHPGPHGRGHQQARPRPAADAAGPRAASPPRRSSPRSST